MFSTAKKYDRATDWQTIQDIEAENEKIYDEFRQCDAEYEAVLQPNDSYYGYYYKINGKANKLYHKWMLALLKTEYSIKDNTKVSDNVLMTLSGVLSLIYTIVTGVLLVMCVIANVLELIKLFSKNRKIVFKLEGYHNLLILPLFISLALLLCSSALWGGCQMTTEFIFALLIECISVAFVAVLLIFEANKDKQSIKRAALKLTTLALAIIACGCAFAPCFEFDKEEYYGDDNSEKYHYSLNVDTMSSLDMAKDRYDEYYADKTHDEWLSMVYGGYAPNDSISYVFLDVKTLEHASAMSTGTVAIILALLALGAMACSALFDEKGGKISAGVFGALALALIVISLAFSAAILVTASKYFVQYEVTSLSIGVGAGILCSLIFAIGAIATLLIGMFVKSIDSPQFDTAIEDEAVACVNADDARLNTPSAGEDTKAVEI